MNEFFTTLKNNFKKYPLTKRHGFTLIEMMVAILIFTLAVLAMMVLLGGGIQDTNLAKNRLVASYLAQEGMEYIHNIRTNFTLYSENGGWPDFVAYIDSMECDLNSGTDFGCYVDASDPTALELLPCLDSGCPNMRYNENLGVYGYASFDPASVFVRHIYVGDDANSNRSRELEFASSVSWYQNGKFHEVVFSDVFFNWMTPI